MVKLQMLSKTARVSRTTLPQTSRVLARVYYSDAEALLQPSPSMCWTELMRPGIRSKPNMSFNDTALQADVNHVPTGYVEFSVTHCITSALHYVY